MKKFLLNIAATVYWFVTSWYLILDTNYRRLIAHPKFNFYKYITQFCIIIIGLFFGVFYKNTLIAWVDFHLILLFGRGFFVFIALLLQTKYKHTILVFFYYWYSIDLRKKSDFLDQLMVSVWTSNILFYRFFASVVHLILLLWPIYFK